MSAHQSTWRAGAKVAIVLALMVPSLTACNPFKQAPKETVVETTKEILSLAPCVTAYGSRIRAASMDETGKRLLYLTDTRPATIDEKTWSSGDRALVVRDVAADSSEANLYHIARTWDSEDIIGVYPTEDPANKGAKPLRPFTLAEQMEDVRISGSGNRFLVAVSRTGFPSGYAKLYEGIVPDDRVSTELNPANGLSVVPINDINASEGISSFALSHDGTKVAALVGNMGELRLYDLAAKKLKVYSLDEGGKVVIGDKLPTPVTNLNVVNRPAVASPGALKFSWNATGDTLAISKAEGVGDASLWSFDTNTGRLVQVRVFKSSTLPEAVWAEDGKSLYVMNTPYSSATIFGDTEVRRIEAVEKGKEIGKGARLLRKPGFKGTPSQLTSFSKNEHFFFVWEGILYRLDAPGGDLSKAGYVPVTVEDVRVMKLMYAPLSAAESADSVAFVAQSGSNTYAVERSHASADQCPEEAVSTSEPAAEGTAPPK